MKHIIVKTVVLTLFVSMALIVNSAQCGPDSETIDPKLLYGTGRIDAIDLKKNYISIGDRQFMISPSVKFYAANQKKLSPKSFKNGDRVSYLLEENKNRRIKVLWKLD